MADPTRDERGDDGRDLKSAVRDRSMEQLEGVKGQFAEGAERVADAVERTADELEGDDAAVSGVGHSLATVMRQLAGGLRERDVEQFATELGGLARRNPGVFLAGSVALGFGVARFFKARASEPERHRYRSDGRFGDETEERRERADLDGEEGLDLSGNPAGFAARGDSEGGDRGFERAATAGSSTQSGAAASADPAGRAKARAGGRRKPGTTRAEAGVPKQDEDSGLSPTESTADSAAPYGGKTP